MIEEFIFERERKKVENEKRSNEKWRMMMAEREAIRKWFEIHAYAIEQWPCKWASVSLQSVVLLL